ncbi:MAG: ketosteroid isomerase [Citrobacter freundii]|nr:MAG: ketosteroid isomerase [Citrobacter freundii]
MPASNRSILEKANAAIANGDHETFLSYCTDNTEWTFVGDRTLRGKEAVRAYMAETYVVPPDVTTDQFISEGDLLTVTGEITLTERNGKTTDYWYCDIWRFEDGKMASVKAFVIEKK